MKALVCGLYHPCGVLHSWERALGRLGSVAYCGLPYGFERSGYMPDVDLTQIPAAERPDVFLYIDEWKPMFPTGLDRVPFPTVAYFPDAGFDIARVATMAPFFDYVFVWNRRALDALRPINRQTFFLPLAYDPERMPRVVTEEKLYDVASVGGVDYRKRRLTMSRAAQRYRTNDWQARGVPLARVGWEYSHSRIVFHCLPEGMPPGMDDDSIRIFEGLGCASLVVTETCDGPSSSIFTPGRHLATYGPHDDPLQVIEYYLEHEEERARIAEAGHREVMARHTVAHRVAQVLETLKANDLRLTAPVRAGDRSQVFLAYQRCFSRLMLIDAMARLFVQDGLPFLTRLRGLGHVFVALRRRLRQLAWRKLAESLRGSFRARATRRSGLPLVNTK